VGAGQPAPFHLVCDMRVTPIVFAVFALLAAPASAKDCRPFGYQTCSFTGWCLNWCNEWENQQIAEKGDRLAINPIFRPGIDPDIPYNPRSTFLPPKEFDKPYPASGR
jgi:hypothetical protein